VEKAPKQFKSLSACTILMLKRPETIDQGAPYAGMS